MRFFLVVIASVFLAGCASGSAIVTGQTRPSIEDHNTVIILTKMPDGAEEIAILKASSDSGLTQQGRLDFAVDELKKQAAKVGAAALFGRSVPYRALNTDFVFFRALPLY